MKERIIDTLVTLCFIVFIAGIWFGLYSLESNWKLATMGAIIILVGLGLSAWMAYMENHR